MAEIERFTALAPRKGNLEPSTDSGAAQALANVSGVASRLAADLRQRADEKIKTEQTDAAFADAAAQTMPGVDFAFDGQSAATTPRVVGPGASVAAAAASGAKGPPLSGSRAEKAAQFKTYLMQKHGVSAEFAAGLVGNFAQESGFNTKAINPGDGVDGSNSIGIAQWNSNRARNLHRFAASQGRPVDDWQLQLDYAMHELGTTEKAAGDRLRAARTVEEATAAAIGFERPAGWSAANPRGGHGWQNRLAAAQSVYGASATAGTAPANAGTPAAAAPSPVTAVPGGMRVTLTGAVPKLTLKPKGTLGNDAYNAAAIAAHSARLDSAMRRQMEAVALQHIDDPAGLEGGLEALRAGYMEGLPPEARIRLDASFEAQKFALGQEAATRYRQNAESATLAAFEETIDTRTRNAYRLAAGDGDPAKIDDYIARELASVEAEIDGSNLSPLQKSRAKANAAEGVTTARVLGGFSAIEDPAGRAAYAKQFQDDYQSGEGAAAGLPVATFDKINTELQQKLNQDRVAATKRDTALEKAVNDQIGFLKKGLPVGEAVRKRLQDEIARTDNPELIANLNFLDGLANLQKVLIAEPPQKIDAAIALLKKQAQETGTTEAAETTLDVLEKLKTSMGQALAEDPLTWADRAGVTKVEPLAFGDPANPAAGPTLAASLAERVTDAVTVGKHYGIDPKFFTPAEADGFKKLLKDTPLAMPSLVSALSAGLGDATPKALAEISKEAPVLAQVAGLVHATGSQRVAVEVAEALDLRNQPGYKSALPTAAKLQSATAELIGGALGGDMSGQAEVFDTAAALFERRALARGIDMDQFDVAGSPARETYLAALDEVLGATTRDGVKYGGVTEVNGSTTIAPPDIEAETLQDLLDNLAGDDLLFQPAIGTANGVRIGVDQIRNGTLVRVADGRYRIATGAIDAGDPLFVPSPAGGYFELDIRMLKKSQEGRDTGGYLRRVDR